MKTAIVHDWFSVYAGSERCIESFVNVLPHADIFSLFDFLTDEERRIILKGGHPKTSYIQKITFAEKHYRKLLPLFPHAVSNFDLKDYDLVISSCHAVSKGVKTHNNQLHICYMYTPMRYIWDLSEQYLADSGLNSGLRGFFAQKMVKKLQKWDLKASKSPDRYIAISKYIAEKIKRIYGRDADVIYPPVDTDGFDLVSGTDDYYVTCSRLVSYKKVDLIASAFARTDKKLVIIGDGSEMAKIKALSGNNIEITGHLPKNRVISIVQRAKAFIFAAEEDFGIAPVEAMACGVPVIAFGRGGAAETVSDGVTGLLFYEQTPNAIAEAVNKFEKISEKLDKNRIRTQALQFSTAAFEASISSYINEKYSVFSRMHP